MKTTKSCPKCHQSIALEAKNCECGWVHSSVKLEEKPGALPHIQCARETCNASARVRVKTPTGWAKFCEPHYSAHFKVIADAKFTAMGLDRWPDESHLDWRKRVREYTKLIVKKAPIEEECEEVRVA